MGISQNFWVNVIGFQLIWWLSILVGDEAIFVVAIIISLHMVFHSQPLLELTVVLLTAILGFSVDLSLTLLGFFSFQNSGLPPLWLLFLWLGFGATLRQSLAIFSKNFALAGLIGSIGAGGTYIAAAKLGAVELSFSSTQSFLLLGAVWVFLFPLLLYLSKRLSAAYAS